MKTIIKKMKFRYFIRGSLYFLVTSFLLAGCEKLLNGLRLKEER